MVPLSTLHAMSSFAAKYKPVDHYSEEDFKEETLATTLLRSEKQGLTSKGPGPLFRHRYGLWISHGILVFFALLFMALWVHAESRVKPKYPIYSPANVVADYNKELTTFNGTFNRKSIYRGHPNLQIDEAWNRIVSNMKPTRLTKEQLDRMGIKITPSKVRFSDEDGGGYMGTIEIVHQLHCLNTLRKYVHYEYYKKFDPLFDDAGPKIFHHCVEIIRQSLMCSADVAMITYEWVKGFRLPYPDFNTKHQCRNYQKILDWANDNAVHIPKEHVTRLPDTVDMLTPP
ncbi:hypothetical protein NLJ89_g4492 [Agrocybe chaxingu]|uniref:Tat pathway signal sequence n=1 Tax=Agrocybe chaxingu TaxID=84603 RepID=A0A9W8K301_9AGAR|nr:hypothetical protein NLJ89_g4492 [Agrocybe chaxingu]